LNHIRETLHVDSSEHGLRLDKWLTERLQDLDYDLSRNQVQNWISDGLIQSTRKRIKASDLVTEGETYEVLIPVPEPPQILPDDIPISLVYEDDDLVVVDKPRGLVVHPAAGHPRGTLLNALVAKSVRLSSLGGDLRPGVVHRIDKDTSGLLVLAKSDLAYYSLSEQLREHSMDRVYLAIVHGDVSHDIGVIDAPIGRDPKNRQRMAVVEDGKPSVTHFRVIERFGKYTYVELKLETGRTHQIRVHMAYIGHPLAGDPLYGKRQTLEIHGQALHAMTLGFTHPRTGERLSFQSPLPQDMTTLLDLLRS
jgi:23S rRNA pseudouridine1911/1915/1917 synthase